MSIFDLFKDKRRRGIIKGSYKQGGLIGKIHNYPVQEFTACVRENETKGEFTNVDIESSTNIELYMLKRDLMEDGSWIPTKDITWID